jgi:hypothetical protein
MEDWKKELKNLHEQEISYKKEQKQHGNLRCQVLFLASQ